MLELDWLLTLKKRFCGRLLAALSLISAQFQTSPRYGKAAVASRRSLFNDANHLIFFCIYPFPFGSSPVPPSPSCDRQIEHTLNHDVPGRVPARPVSTSLVRLGTCCFYKCGNSQLHTHTLGYIEEYIFFVVCVWVCVYKGRESQWNVAIGLVNQPDTSHGPSYMHAATISTPVYARNGVCRLSASMETRW